MMGGWRGLLAGCAAGLALTACSAVPGAGPRRADIEAVAGQFPLIDLTPDVTARVTDFVVRQRPQGPVTLPVKRAAGRIGPGDLLKIVIWQSNPASASTAPDKPGLDVETRVGVDGTIGVPYAGRMRVADHTPAAVEQAIDAKLSEQMPGAQVSVVVTEDVTNTIVVQGDVARPGRYRVVPGGSGLLDMLAEAGGTRSPERQSLVRVTRADTSVSRPLTQLVETHALEADLAPGDRILVQPRPHFIYAFGAVKRPGEQPYDGDDTSLAHTLARLQGLEDRQADPAAVFLYRRQPAELTRALVGAAAADPSRVIYRLDLRSGGGFFLAQDFPVLPEDVIYVSEAPISEASKVLQLLSGASAIGAIPRNLGATY